MPVGPKTSSCPFYAHEKANRQESGVVRFSKNYKRPVKFGK